MADKRSRYWSAILYPESLPLDWKIELERTLVPIAISPLHDQDVWTAEDEQKNPDHVAGTLKKPHYHVMLYFDSVKSVGQVLDLLAALDVHFVKPVPNVRTYNRYLAHLDQPNKAEYNPDDIVCLNGATCDVSKPIPTSGEQLQIRGEVVAIIRGLGIVEYSDLVEYVEDNCPENFQWYVEHHTVYLNSYLRSRRHRERSHVDGE